MIAVAAITKVKKEEGIIIENTTVKRREIILDDKTVKRRGDLLEHVTIRQRIDTTLTATNIITYTAVSIFLPYVLSAIILGFLAIYIMMNQQKRQLVFIHSGSFVLKLFFAYILLIPMIYGNWKGLAVGAGMILVLILGLYLRSVMTKEYYEKNLTLICALSLTSTCYALLEVFINFVANDGHSHRISAVFSHPNYFGTIAATVIIICAYKILTSLESKWFYYFVAAANVISMYLCKSMFAFVEVFIGIMVLLAVLKRYKLLTIWLSVATLGAVLVFILGVDLIPRLSDVEVTLRLRRQIWSLAIEQIKKNPLFGHGFFSFGYLYDAMYHNQQISHAHSIYLDTVLNFGVVGTVLFLGYLVRCYLSVIVNCVMKKNVMIAALILAVTASTLVHGATDMTILWFQTAALFLIILAGQDIEENENPSPNLITDSIKN